MAFHIADNYLGSTIECRAVWSSVSEDIPLNTAWNLVTGAPQADVFQLEDCEYEGETPLALYPSPTMLVDGLDHQVSPDAESHTVHSLFEVNAGQNVEVNFHYEVVDAYAAETHRAKVYSSSDRAGEWAAISEVASMDDDAPSAASSLYRGEVAIGTDEAIRAVVGDGIVFVRKSSRMSVRYYDADGETELDKHSVALALPTPTPTPTSTPMPPQRHIDVRFMDTPTRSGDAAVIHIADNYLGSTVECRAVWSSVSEDIPADTAWNLVSGAPQASVFNLEGCEYDGETPLALYPRPTMLVDGLEHQTSPDATSHTVRSLFEVNTGQNVEVNFHYEVVDVYPTQMHRAKVYSSSDRAGEWVAISEVAGRKNRAPSASSYLYRGKVAIGTDEAIRAVAGDGIVFVRKSSRLSARYYDADGETELGRHSVALDLLMPSPTAMPTPAPTPTPVPAANEMLLTIVAMAIVGVLVRRYGSGNPSEC